MSNENANKPAHIKMASLIAGAKAGDLPEELIKFLTEYQAHLKDPEDNKNPLTRRTRKPAKDIETKVRRKEGRTLFQLPPLFGGIWGALHAKLGEDVPSYKYQRKSDSMPAQMTCAKEDEAKMKATIEAFFADEKNSNGPQAVNYEEVDKAPPAEDTRPGEEAAPTTF